MSVLQAVLVSTFFCTTAIVGLTIAARQVVRRKNGAITFVLDLPHFSTKVKIGAGLFVFLVSSFLLLLTLASHWYIVLAPIIACTIAGGKMALRSIEDIE